MEVRRIAADVISAPIEILLNEHVITKVEAHEEHGISGSCVRVHSDEMPPMICLGSRADIEKQIDGNDRRAAEEVAIPLMQTLENMETRVAKLEALLG